MEWRAVGDAGEYPDWLRKLRGKCGVYAIRERARSRLLGLVQVPAVVVYVGESHTGRLYQTLTRHFQGWNRGKDPKWYGGKYVPRQTDPGHTYDRRIVEVRIRVARTPTHAMELQDEWLRALVPRDNRIGVDLEDAPF